MNQEQPCPGWLEAIAGYMDGALAPGEEQRVHGHLRGCPGCAKHLIDLVPVIQALKAMPAPAPGRDLWPEIASSLAADPAFKRGGVVTIFRKLPKPALGWAAAGVAFVAIGSGVFAGWLAPEPVPVADTDTYWHQHQLHEHVEGLPTLYAPELSAIEASYQLDE